MKRHKLKLSLNKETVRYLTADEARNVVGGRGFNSLSCLAGDCLPSDVGCTGTGTAMCDLSIVICPHTF
jgi:hypothetical protein